MSYKKDKGKELRSRLDDSLDDLLNDDNLLDDMTDGNNLPKVHAPEQHDYVKIKDGASEKARKTITSLMKFYLSEDIIDSDEYIQAKKRIDEMTLSSLIFQLEAGEKALVTLLNTINSGELSPRMFEVLATLQKSMLDIIKSQTMYLMAAEESAKKISRDVEVYKGLKRNVSQPAVGSGPANINMGTKGLMQSIQDEIKAEGPKEVEKAPEITLDEMSEVTSVESIEVNDDDDEELRNYTSNKEDSDFDEDDDDELSNMDREDEA